MSVDDAIDELMETEQNVFGVAVVNGSKQLVTQTENWDISPNLDEIWAVKNGEASSVTLQGIRYMIVENVPERIIGTNVTGKGHIIMCPVGDGLLVTYINPQVGPRDALFNVQSSSQKFAPFV
ncbi:MAG: hypothetical protein ACTSU5_06695 [Promethearchaeota archaeon]